MTINIESLRKMRKTDFSSITDEMEKIINPIQGGQEDTRLWKLTRDKAGNGSAEIRFLPKKEGDQLPWVKMYTHGFKGPTGKWYIENSLTTIGEQDYCGEENTRLWNTGLESDKKIAQERKRRLNYYANILVISDPANPENNGQVKLFRFGKKIFDKIMDKAKPTFADETPVNVFDLWEGANFKLRCKQVEGYPNFDTSIFSEPSELFGGDENKLLSVVNQQHQLSELVSADKFKSYDILRQKYIAVVNSNVGQVQPATTMTESYTPEPVKSSSNYMSESKPAVSSGGDDDIMEYFNSLTNKD